MIKTIIELIVGGFNQSQMQREFNIVQKRAMELVNNNPDEVAEVKVMPEADSATEFTLMNVYTDFDEDEPNSEGSVHIWYNKEILDALEIKYDLKNG